MADATYGPGRGGAWSDARERTGERSGERTVGFTLGRARRISWAAVLAGFFAAIACQYLLGLLGLSIGLTSIEPATEGVPSVETFSTGIIIWWIVSGIISLFAGGLIAGRLADVHIRLDGALNGLVAWCLTAVLMMWMMTSAAGRLMNTAVSALGYGVQTLGSGAAYMVPDSVPDVSGALSGWDQQAVDQVADEFRLILQQTGKPELQPENIEDRLNRVNVQGAAQTVATRPARADEAAERVMNQFITQMRQIGQAADREAVVNVIVARTDMSEQEAGRVVDRWAAALQRLNRGVVAAAEDTADAVASSGEEIASRAAHVTQYTMETLAAAAFWSFVAMLLGAGAAFAGGWVGAPSHTHVQPVRAPLDGDQPNT